jgi:hypothetical protein
MRAFLLGVACRVAAASILLPIATYAQTPAPANLKFDIALTVPVQLKDLNPEIIYFNMFCWIQQAGLSGTTGRVGSKDAMGAHISNGAYSGNVVGHFTITSTQAFPPNQQWNYSCYLEFLKPANNGTTDDVPGTPGVDSWALIASGSNSVQGSFTTP